MQVYLQISGQKSTLSTIRIFEFRLRVRKGGPWFRVSVVLISHISVRWIFGGLVSNLHNWGCIMGSGRGNFGDLGCGGWDVGVTGVLGQGLYLHTLYKAWKVADLPSLTFKCLISNLSIFVKPNRVSVVGGFCTHP